jgi:alanine racemase
MSRSVISATIDYQKIANNARSIINTTKTPLMAVVKARYLVVQVILAPRC